jgi:DNA-directed RNA polymerase specialized sigma24 family protein
MPPADSQLREVQRLFLEHALRLRGFVLGLVADRATAEDVLHEVFLRYASPAPSLDEVARRMAWTVGSVKVALTRARQALWECTQRRMAATAAHLGRQET